MLAQIQIGWLRAGSSSRLSSCLLPFFPAESDLFFTSYRVNIARFFKLRERTKSTFIVAKKATMRECWRMSSIDLNRLRVFVKIVQLGSLTRAGEALHLPKSRVSRVLAALERDFREQLLYRTTREIRLTEAGKKLYNVAKDAVAQLENVSEHLQSGSESLEGLIRLTAPEDFGVKVLPPLVAEFRSRHPLVRFDLLLSQDYVDLVRESVDIAVRFGKLSDSSLRAQKVGTISLILVASPRFLELNPPPKDVREIIRLPCLGFQGSSRFPWKLQDGRVRIELKVDPVLEANEPVALLELAMLDQGIAFLPESLCGDALQSGKLVHLYRSWRSHPAPAHIMHTYKKEIPARVKSFLDFLAQELPKKF